MTKLKLSLAAIAILSTSIMANDIINFDKGYVTGEVSTQYRYNDSDNFNEFFAGVANVNYKSNQSALLSVGFNFYGVSGFDMISDKDRMPGFLDNGTDFAIMNEAYIALNKSGSGFKSNLTAGRFHMDEGLINSQEDTNYDYPVPNSFQGISTEVSVASGITVSFAWIDKMSGQDNGLDNTDFMSVQDIAQGYNPAEGMKDSNGLYFAKLAYAYESLGDISLEALIVDKYATTYLQELNVKVMKGLTLSQQYINYEAETSNVSADVLGLKAAYEVIKGVDIAFAYNKTNDSYATGFEYGADPLYTSMTFVNSYGLTDVDTFKVSSDIETGTTKVTVAYANISARVADIDAYEIGASFDYNADIEVKGIYGYTDNSILDNQNNFRVVATYSF